MSRFISTGITSRGIAAPGVNNETSCVHSACLVHFLLIYRWYNINKLYLQYIVVWMRSDHCTELSATLFSPTEKNTASELPELPQWWSNVFFLPYSSKFQFASSLPSCSFSTLQTKNKKLSWLTPFLTKELQQAVQTGDKSCRIPLHEKDCEPHSWRMDFCINWKQSEIFACLVV